MSCLKLSSHLYLGLPCDLLAREFHLNIFLTVLVSSILCTWPNQLSLWALIWLTIFLCAGPVLPLHYQNAKTTLYEILLSGVRGPKFQNNKLPPSSSFITRKALYFSTLPPSLFTLQRSVKFHNNYDSNILTAQLWRIRNVCSEGICFNYGTRYGYSTNIFADSPQLFEVNAGMKP